MPVSRLITLGLTCCLLGIPSTWADDAQLTFDFPSLVACREVITPDDPPEPGRKLVELVLRVSMRCQIDQSNEIAQVRFFVRDPTRTMQVHDFAPTTVLASEIIGDIEQAVTTERESSANAGLGGDLAVPAGPAALQLKPVAKLGTTRRETIIESVRREPPKQLVVSSGTVDANHGVYFQFVPTPQLPLEGTRKVVCLWNVPTEWRGGRLEVDCQGWRRRDYIVIERTEPAGRRRGDLAVYLLGDREARAVAEAYSTAEWRLREAAGRRDPFSRTLHGVIEETQQGLASLEDSLSLRHAREYDAADRHWQDSRQSLQQLSSGS